MFSESISSLINSGGAETAKSRVSQIEGMITQYANKIQGVNPPTGEEKTAVQFSNYMNNVSASDEIKFKVVPPPAPSKGYVQQLIKKVASKYGLDERLVAAVVKQESGFNSNAVSSCGAQGLMQLMPSTAKGLGVRNPFDPEQNLEGGVKYLKGLMDRYNGNLVLALAAYNAGSGNIQKYGGVPPFKETQNYVRKILSEYLS